MVVIDQVTNTYKKLRAKHYASAYVRHIQKDQNIRVSEAYLFGSYANGKSKQWSDIDVCVVSPDFKNIDALVYLWRHRTKKDSQNRIEPVGFDDVEFNEDRPLPIISEIKRSGIRLI